MRSNHMEPYSLSGVPLVFDRFGMVGPWIAEVADPLSAARGIATGLALAGILWLVPAALMI